MMPTRRRLDEAQALDPALTKPTVGNWSKGRHIYFIQGRPGGLIKIGSANDPWRRFKDIQACCPIRLWLIGVIWEGGPFEERGLHYRFEHLRRHNEWFRPGAELLAHIEANATDPLDLPSKEAAKA